MNKEWNKDVYLHRVMIPRRWMVARHISEGGLTGAEVEYVAVLLTWVSSKVQDVSILEYTTSKNMFKCEHPTSHSSRTRKH